MTTEWRVATFHVQGVAGGKPVYDPKPLVVHCDDEIGAREVAELERQDYPLARVHVQRRETSPWEVVA